MQRHLKSRKCRLGKWSESDSKIVFGHGVVRGSYIFSCCFIPFPAAVALISYKEGLKLEFRNLSPSRSRGVVEVGPCHGHREVLAVSSSMREALCLSLVTRLRSRGADSRAQCQKTPPHFRVHVHVHETTWTCCHGRPRLRVKMCGTTPPGARSRRQNGSDR